MWRFSSIRLPFKKDVKKQCMIKRNEEIKSVILGPEKELNWVFQEINWKLKSERGWEYFRQWKWIKWEGKKREFKVYVENWGEN